MRLRMRPRLTVRTRLTVLVALATTLVLLVAAIIGPAEVEQALVDDMLDSAAADQVKYSTDLELRSRAGWSQRGGLFEALNDIWLYGDLAEIETQAFALEDVKLLREVVFAREALLDLARFELLDELLDTTGSSRRVGVPVVMSNGYLVVLSPDTSTAVRLADATQLDSPVISFPALLDLTLKASRLDRAVSLEALTGSDLDHASMRSTPRLVFDTRSINDVDFVVTAEVSDLTRSVDRIRSIMWATTPLVVLAAVVVTWLLTGRALRPVAQITAQVEEINAGTLNERVPQPATGDEIDRLATTMNDMLDRLESHDTRLRQFVSDASHELRSPVAVLRSEAEVALRRPEDTAVSDLASGVLSESRRLQRIVDDLLVLARHDEGRSGLASELVDLDDIVLDEASRSRAVPVDVSAVSAGQIRASGDTARRIVAHLLDNATRHARERVAVALAADPDHQVVLAVDDDGEGIAEGDRIRVFERFTRLEEARSRDTGGAGLGLAVVAALVNELGGSVAVEDSALGGARLVVHLPAASG